MHRIEIVEAGIAGDEIQVNVPVGPLRCLAMMISDFALSSDIFLIAVVIRFAMNERHYVGVLLNRARLAQIAQHRPLVVAAPLAGTRNCDSAITGTSAPWPAPSGRAKSPKPPASGSHIACRPSRVMSPTSAALVYDQPRGWRQPGGISGRRRRDRTILRGSVVSHLAPNRLFAAPARHTRHKFSRHLRQRHGNGLHMALCDGSVQMISSISIPRPTAA